MKNDGFDFYFRNYDILYVCFAGFYPDEKGVPVFEFKNLLNKVDASLLFVRDVYKCWYQLGISGLGSSLEQSISFMKEFIKPYKKVVMVGNSMGGYAALLFGAVINPSKVIAISPQTYLKNDELLYDDRWSEYFVRARKFNNNEDYLDLRNFSNCKKEQTLKNEVAIYYSINDVKDKSHVDLISESNIVFIPCHGSFHETLVQQLKERNLLFKILFHNVEDINVDRTLFPKSRIIFKV